MSNLRNPALRCRDIRKITTLISYQIVWDEGCETNNEWFYASLENERNTADLFEWMNSKSIGADTELILVEPAWHSLKKLKWKNLISDPQLYFKIGSFQLFDVDLKWLLEYKDTEIIRFGRYRESVT